MSEFKIKGYRFRCQLRAGGRALLSGLVLVLAGSPGFLQAQEKAPLSSAECRQLFEHQFNLARKDPGNPLLKPLNLDPASLNGRQATVAELSFCQQRISRPNYSCQLQAQGLQALVACYQKYPLQEAQNPGDVRKQEPTTPVEEDRKKPDSKEEQSNEEQRRPPRTLPQNPLPVNASNCQKGYAHMYQLLSTAPDLKQAANRERLLAHWQSQSARSAFQKRCLQDFTAEDMGCILGSQDRQILQACLLVIPE